MSSTPEQLQTRARFEGVIALAAPFLDLLLAAGDRLSRLTGPDDEPIPIRAPGEAFELRASRPRRLPAGGDSSAA
jgi:hypothetical protein